MKAVVAFLVILVAVAAAQTQLSESQAAVLRQESQALTPERSYINKVEYVDQLETAPNPELVPKYFVEASRRRRIGRKIGRAVRKVGRGARKVARKIGRGVRKIARKLRGKKRRHAKRRHGKRRHGKRRHGKRRHGKRRHAKRRHAKRRLVKRRLAKRRHGKRHAKRRHGKRRHGKRRHGKRRHGKRRHGKKGMRKLKKQMKKRAKKAARKAKKLAKKGQRKLQKRAKKTDHRIKRAMSKLRHLSTSVSGLKTLMKRIDGQVQRLIPENKIRKYVKLDPSKFSNSGYSKTLKGDPRRFVNPYKKNQNNEVFYNKQVIDPALRVIRKDEDMSAQELAMKQKQLSKFTHKLARKDTVSLV